ncbi:MAG: outer membrane lipoprotein-sorting protein [Myxococcota bacterium]|nr:outer membrane lipoprotein-sorting protein [Myxococcota bacterium]
MTKLFLLLLVFSFPSLASPPLAPKPTAAPLTKDQLQALLTQVDDSGRSNSSHVMMSMRVKTKRFARTMKMETWSKGKEHSLIRLLEPAKDSGVATLKVGDKLWNYLPNTDRVMRVPSAMMSGAWMGSHISNDDLVKEYRLSEDYTFSLVPGSKAGGEETTIRCTPKPATPVVWGYVDVTVQADGVPLRQEFFSEKGRKVRTMTYSEVKEIAGIKVPHKMVIKPEDKPDEFTEMVFHTMELNIAVDESLFSLQSLRD